MLFCLDNPQPQPPCQPVRVIRPCLGLKLALVQGTNLALRQSFMLQWPVESSIALNGWNLTLPLQKTVWVDKLCYHFSWHFLVLHPKRWSLFWTKKTSEVVETISKVYIIGSNYLVQGSYSFVCHVFWLLRYETGGWKKWYVFFRKKFKD